MASGESVLVAVVRILADRYKWSCCSDQAIRIVGFAVSLGLTLFNVITDWVVVGTFRGNPLLSISQYWLYAWIVLSFVGTVLAVYSSITDFVLLVHDWKLHGTHKKSSDESDSDCACYFGREHDCCWKCCTDCGCNRLTRSESLVAITVWLYSYPILVLAFYYTFFYGYCPTPFPLEAKSLLASLGVSMIAWLLAFLSTVIRSWINVIFSMWIGQDHQEKWKAKSLCAMKCLPERDDAAYPHNMNGRFGLLCGSLCSLTIQCTIGIAFFIVVWGGLCGHYAPGDLNDLYREPIGIYRVSINAVRSKISSVSDVILANGEPINTFIRLDSRTNNEFGYCAYSFEYRAEDFQILYNCAQLSLISEEGKFCTIVNGGSNVKYGSVCRYYFDTEGNFYVDSRNKLRPANSICSFRSYSLFDISTVNVSYRLSQAGFKLNNEPVMIYFSGPESDFNIPVLSVLNGRSSHVISFSTLNISCAVNFTLSSYDSDPFYPVMWGNIRFNAVDVINYPMPGCTCGSDTNCATVLRNQLAYGYVSPDGNVTQYTQCFTIPPDELVPLFDSTVPVSCPCS